MKTAVLLISILLAFAVAQGCAPKSNPSSGQVTSPAATMSPLVAATPEPRKLTAEEQTALSEFAGFAGTRVTPDKFQAHMKEVQAKASEYTTKFPLVGGDQWDFLVVQAAFANGQYADALTASDAFIAKYPDSAQLEQVMMLRGYSLFSTKQYDLAAQQYYAVTEQFPDSANLPLAMYNCGANYYMAQKMDEAVEMLE
ncbi:MAG: tetratricopeptide repeat protein, partial [Candidatus Brocadiia bacterium]